MGQLAVGYRAGLGTELLRAADQFNARLCKYDAFLQENGAHFALISKARAASNGVFCTFFSPL